MTAAEVAEIDGALQAQGWRYHAASETFLDRDDNLVDWHEVLLALPDLSLNQLEAYRNRKFPKLARG